jgi:two-component system, LytTR family, response regulator
LDTEGQRSAKIRTLVVDDEPLARSNLAVLLRSDPEVDLVGECSSGNAAVAEIRRTRPDLVFLDVQMPECDGFDVLELLGSAAPPAIVFVTAYDEYALRAFDAGALDYLLKPFDDARFRRALERAKATLASSMQSRHRAAERLMVKEPGQVTFVKVAEIDWVDGGQLLRVPARGCANTRVAPQPLGTRGRVKSQQVLPHSPRSHCQPRSNSRS